MSRKINNVCDKYKKYYDWWNVGNKEEFEKFIFEKIDWFTIEMFNQLKEKINQSKLKTLCLYTNELLKNNIYNRDISLFNFYFEMCFIEIRRTYDFGSFMQFDYRFGNSCDINGLGYENNLIIESLFIGSQGGRSKAFELIYSYSDPCWEVRDMKEYYDKKNDNGFFIIDQELIDDYYDGSPDSIDDFINLRIIDLNNYQSLYSEIKTMDQVEKLRIEFDNAINKYENEKEK